MSSFAKPSPNAGEPPRGESAIKAIKIVGIAVCTVTTAVMCANLIAFGHVDMQAGHRASPASSAKMTYPGRAERVAHV